MAEILNLNALSEQNQPLRVWLARDLSRLTSWHKQEECQEKWMSVIIF
jgi:hypothetical protein